MYLHGPNGLELSCPAAQATVDLFSRNSAGKSRSSFPHASRVSCSELLGRIGFRLSTWIEILVSAEEVARLLSAAGGFARKIADERKLRVGRRLIGFVAKIEDVGRSCLSHSLSEAAEERSCDLD